ncbi:uncharacterized protein [Nicotiana sylvestris]|uniref:Uncharacterized protein LOC104217245 n=1 Tax=Nicotiana sylvestris TaxID=4096 RepID=A0A1U7VV02_NICSY|nr:PREDICTED: uncharacterized protein LOC104217245 [Nicotiana sylvestris]
MSQERPSKPKKKTSATYTKPGTMASLANQIRASFSQKYVVPARQSNKEQPNIIEENLPQYLGAVAHVQTRSTTSAKYVVLARQSNKEHSNIIEENLLVPQYSGVVAHVQTRSTTPATQVIEEQVQLDSTTPIKDEQCEEQDVVIELVSFLGTLGRNATLCPLDILDWRKMDTKEDIYGNIPRINMIFPKLRKNIFWNLFKLPGESRRVD